MFSSKVKILTAVALVFILSTLQSSASDRKVSILAAASEGSCANFTFITDSCSAAPYSKPYYCDKLKNFYDLENGSVCVDAYEAYLKGDFDADGTVSKTDDDATLTLSMKNNFPAGGAVGAIIVNIALGDYFDGGSHFKGHLTDVSFNKRSYRSPPNAEISFFQDNTGTLPISNDYVDILSIQFDFSESGFTPSSYDDKYVELEFIGIYSETNDTTHVTDTTGSVTAHSFNGRLSWEMDSVQVLMGEYSLASASGTCTATQDLRVRSTFDIDSFSVTITANSTIDITGINTGVMSNVSATFLGGFAWKIYSTSGFSQGSSGDSYNTFAEIDYELHCSCNPGNQYNLTPSVSNDLLKSSSGVEYSLTGANQVTITCPTPDGCNCDQQQKLAQEGAQSTLPTQFRLHPCHPNPFNPETAIDFDLPKMSHVRIDVLNILGQIVTTLVDNKMEAGYHSVMWYGTDEYGIPVPTGVYLSVMQAGGYRHMEKMMLLK